MVKVYTKTGDDGTTGLLTGQRVSKDSLRVEAYGTVDEVNSALGMARALCTDTEVRQTIHNLQKLLMLLMAEIASQDAGKSFVHSEHSITLEQQIDHFDAKLPPLNHFIVPGDTPGAAALDLARTVTRRAERCVLRLSHEEPVNEQVRIVLNRLSDLCFVLSRMESQERG
ncbi:atp:cob(i)alamin adenosyltransferase pduo-type [Lucifera butyrica]|uniref:Corrinoid adenosyltransferase n=1 Tax=Lucifera butyrica TaxID=1351585 RepID=A0A498QZN6_9FIRM|nr:cob(I)yrinic acid a,c-diamide adenosyltransferase [Lucifera butyrica]VBB05676.1 atp:cob(i)alamin adenosyltransferase pduo-type [Lucifera butyrica]